MTLLVIAFLSGVLTVLAPCVLPLLPVILGASAEDGNNKKIPLIVISSLSVSVLVFSLLLKASTLLIDVPPSFWKTVSGGLLIFLGIITIFPNIWKNISTKFGFSGGANSLLQSGNQKQGMFKYVLLGAALGPVFSSCSPTYSLILAIILPAGFAFGVLALISYVLGLATILLLIAILGQKCIKNLRWVSNPNGIFKKILGGIFLLIGLAIISGFDKKIEAKILDAGFLNTTNFEQSIIDELDLGNTEKKTKQSQGNPELKTGGQCKDGNCEKSVSGSLNFLSPESILGDDTGYEAPDFSGLQNWINSDPIDSLKELQGKVVMIDFWTLGCINCINTHKETNKLYKEFKDEGLEIVGIHAPEFQYERKLSAVKEAVVKYGITFPVAQDNDFTTWKLYNNRYWPAFYIIDKKGNVRYTHFGEGGYEKKREVIEELLAENYGEDLSPTLSLEEREQAAVSSLPLGENGERATEKLSKQAFSEEGLTTNTAKTSILLQHVLDGGPGKDGIPAINNPKFISQEAAKKSSAYLEKNDLGIVISRGDEARFYGYDVLVWHEIVNDEIAGEKISVTFCPLCGSAIVYDRSDVNGKEVKFGVSGKLYNSNLLMYDSHDESLWSQSQGKALMGNQLGTKLQVVEAELMNYSEFQKTFPKGVVLSNETGYQRSYGQIPYGNYNDTKGLYFPAPGGENTLFHPKKLFYVIPHDDDSLAFAWDDLREEGSANIEVGEKEYIAKYENGKVDVTLDGVSLPGYFEMWFSWVSSHEGNTNIWSKK